MCITNSDTLIQFFEQYVPMYEKAAFERGYKEGKALAKTIILNSRMMFLTTTSCDSVMNFKIPHIYAVFLYSGVA